MDARSSAPPPGFSIRWVSDASVPARTVVEITGISAVLLEELQRANWETARWEQLLAVFVASDAGAVAGGQPPMLGTYRIHAGALRFEPQYPLSSGVKYRAVFWPGRLPGESSVFQRTVVSSFQLPAPPRTPGSVVSRVFPSADVLPENLLKFYVHFSAPMNRGRIYDHIHLRDAAGKEVELPFLEIDEELWNPEMTRLTLFIDPGRIKRGVRPLEEIGPALEAGRRYTLVIGSAWQDAAGRPLRAAFEKKFRVGPPDRDPLEPLRWKIQPPSSTTRGPLTVTFPKPMDHALALRLIQVTSSTGELIEGNVALSDQERRWTFTPAQPWRRGAHRLVIQTTLEDLAGNNIGKAFEVDLFEGVQRRLTRPTVLLPFEIP